MTPSWYTRYPGRLIPGDGRRNSGSQALGESHGVCCLERVSDELLHRFWRWRKVVTAHRCEGVSMPQAGTYG